MLSGGVVKGNLFKRIYFHSLKEVIPIFKVPRKFSLSLEAFRMSPHCNGATIEAFYNSYLDRKYAILERKLHTLRGAGRVNKDKLMAEAMLCKFAKENKELTLREIKRVMRLGMPVPQEERASLLSEVESVLER